MAEYADFSDLEKQNLPDALPEIEENAPEEQHTPIDYFKEETPEKETQEVKPEPETSKEPKSDPNSFQYWQSQADKRDKELRAEREQREQLQREIEAIKGQLNPKKEPEVLVPPTPPRSDDPVEEIRYAREYAEYVAKANEQKFGKYDAYFQQLEAEKQQRVQQEQLAQQRAWQVSQLAQSGLSPEEANQALADFSRDAETPEQYFKDLAEFWKFRKGYKENPKTSKIEQRANRQNGLPPLGTTPSEIESASDPNDQFFGDMQGFIKRNY